MRIWFYILITLIIVAILDFLIRKSKIAIKEYKIAKKEYEKIEKEIFKILENKVDKYENICYTLIKYGGLK